MPISTKLKEIKIHLLSVAGVIIIYHSYMYLSSFQIKCVPAVTLNYHWRDL